jgi:hypothetical protein
MLPAAGLIVAVPGIPFARRLDENTRDVSSLRRENLLRISPRPQPSEPAVG